MIDATQFRELIVRPTLDIMGLWSQTAEDLVMGTGAQESRFTYLRQVGGGPALGLFQVEPGTYDDYIRWLDLQDGLTEKILTASRLSALPQDPGAVIGNLPFAVACCRVHYRRIPEALPPEGHVYAYANYWKTYYNTIHGAGTVTEFVNNYRSVARQ